jgi:cyclic 2,3-diphosphoglycerate synthetase
VVRDAIGRLEVEHVLTAVLFVGGEEKLSSTVLRDAAAHYGRPVEIASDDLAGSLRTAAAAAPADAVIDLSGDPVLSPAQRMLTAAVALGLGLEYRAPGLVLAPPPQERVPGAPVVAVIGTGKRVGKTALAGHLAGLLSERGERPVIVSMGRGGPAEPVLMPAGAAPDLSELLALARAGAHAASDYLEDAVLWGVATVGCRRCGEGPAGEALDSNAVAGVRLAMSTDPSLVVLEGSGSGIPPVAAERTACVVSAPEARASALSGLGPLRLQRSQLVVLAGADAVPARDRDRLAAELGRWCPEGAVVASRLAPEPAGDLPPGARVALFSTAGERAGALREELEESGVEIALSSGNLARRAALEADLDAAARAGCDTYLTELKAAAIDTVADRAEAAGAAVEFLRHRPRSLPGEPSLDEELLELCAAAVAA